MEFCIDFGGVYVDAESLYLLGIFKLLVYAVKFCLKYRASSLLVLKIVVVKYKLRWRVIKLSLLNIHTVHCFYFGCKTVMIIRTLPGTYAVY